MSKIKSVSQFEDNIWGEATPIGADASNVDVEMSDSSTKDLQTVLGDIPSTAAPMQSQINAKVTTSGGNIGSTIVSSGIQNFDSSSSETSTELLDANVRVVNATEVTSSMWTKFNRFRKRVDNKFKDVFLSSVEDVASPSLTKTYSQAALNDYFANVVGYATAIDLPDASSTIASQLSTLNNDWADHTHWKYEYLPTGSSSGWSGYWFVLSLPKQSLIFMWTYSSTSFSPSQWSSWGSEYYTPTTPYVDFPENITFATIPYAWTGGRILQGDAWWCASASNISLTRIGGMYAIRPNKPTTNIVLEPHYFVIGRYSSYTHSS